MWLPESRSLSPYLYLQNPEWPLASTTSVCSHIQALPNEILRGIFKPLCPTRSEVRRQTPFSPPPFCPLAKFTRDSAQEPTNPHFGTIDIIKQPPASGSERKPSVTIKVAKIRKPVGNTVADRRAHPTVYWKMEQLEIYKQR